MENTKPSASALKDAYDWLESVVSAIVICILVFVFAFRVVSVDGSSMVPTLHNGEKVVINRFCTQPKQGDIVVLTKKSFMEESIVKRVIATAGQTVDIDFDSGIVYVDGTALEENYVNDLTYTEEGTQFPLTVPEDSVFLMGDNRNMSTDSRDERIGTLDTRYLIGKAVFLLFPGPDYVTEERDFSRIGSLSRG